jgi:hypothetical protein
MILPKMKTGNTQIELTAHFYLSDPHLSDSTSFPRTNGPIHTSPGQRLGFAQKQIPEGIRLPQYVPHLINTSLQRGGVSPLTWSNCFNFNSFPARPFAVSTTLQASASFCKAAQGSASLSKIRIFQTAYLSN